MKIPLPNILIPRQKTLTAADVIRLELKKAHDLAPGYLLPTSVIGALEDAGFTIMAVTELDQEIILAYQAGYQGGADS